MVEDIMKTIDKLKNYLKYKIAGKELCDLYLLR